ncbi:MAG TPA: molybdopterin-binding protein [Pseudolabrys sp.]|nr:molybdopterin-binding protein [Pseudolabrys sp.]
MAVTAEAMQTISRLTPLADVLAMIDTEVKSITQRTIDVSAAMGRALASDAMAPARPASSLALQDGWALNADETLGASGYTPVQLMRTPARIEAGHTLPAGTDSVAPLDAVKITSDHAEALAAISPGDGVLAAGGDNDSAIPLRRAGERLRATDLAAFAATGLVRVTVREPRVRVLPLRGSGIISAAARLLTADIERRGGAARLDESGRGLDVAMAAESSDMLLAIGGTGSGRNDNSVQVLAREGRLAVHGLALTPGETAALGFVGPRPVLLVPGRLDATLSVWLVLGRRLLDRLSAARSSDGDSAAILSLARKVTSTVGLAEVVPVRRIGGQAEPLASKYLPLSSLARSDGWILVPADSEGFSGGSAVQVRPWP